MTEPHDNDPVTMPGCSTITGILSGDRIIYCNRTPTEPCMCLPDNECGGNVCDDHLLKCECCGVPMVPLHGREYEHGNVLCRRDECWEYACANDRE